MPNAIAMYSRSAEWILISIPCTIIIAYLPLIARYFGVSRMGKLWDNANPRLYIASLENEALSGNYLALLPLRAHAAHLNSIEDLAIFVPACIASFLFSQVDKLAIICAAIHMGLRCIYLLIYIFNSSPGFSYVRTLVWFLAWACPMIMLFEAAHQVGWPGP